MSVENHEIPRVLTLDARSRGFSPHGLRQWARALARASGARFVSRSYRYPIALVAMHSKRVGVDLERIESCDAALAELICTPAELRDQARLTDRDRHLSTLWCSKEALAKALGDARAYEPSLLDSPLSWSDGRRGVWRAAALGVAPGYVAWLCSEASDDRHDRIHLRSSSPALWRHESRESTVPEPDTWRTHLRPS